MPKSELLKWVLSNPVLVALVSSKPPVGGGTTSASAKRGATRDGQHVGGHHTIVLEGTHMKTNKGAKAIPAPESPGQVRFPLLLNLDLVQNIQGVWAGNGTLRTIKRLEVLCKVQREPLEVIYTPLRGLSKGLKVSW